MGKNENLFYVLKLGFNKLILSFDEDHEASISSSIIKGEIYDSNIMFSNKIQIGMNSESFYKIFFL